MALAGNDKEFEAGDMVVLRNGGFHTCEQLVRVRKVWKNGVVEAEYLNGNAVSTTFRPDGYSRGDHYYHSSIRHLPDGTTPEMFLAAQAEERAKEQAAQAAKAAERAAAIKAWWAAEGEAMWAARVTLPAQFNVGGHEVHVIRFTERDGKIRQPFVVIRRVEKRWGNTGNEMEFIVGGLVIRTYETSDKVETNINTYSSSMIKANTLEEGLYDVTH